MANFDTYAGSLASAVSTMVIDTVGCTGAYVMLSGTYAGVTVNFEGTVDGGTTWVPLGAYQINANGVVGATSAVLGTNAQVQYYVLVGAAKQMRLRNSAWTSGTMAVSIMTVQSADPILL